MQKSITGRLDRPHYWIILVAALAAKVALKLLIGGSIAGNASLGLDFVILAAIVARLHDVGLSTSVGIVAWLALVGVQIFAAFQAGTAAMPGWVVLLSLGMFALVGAIKGEAQKNRFGPPGQGFRGINRIEVESASSTNPLAIRIAKVRG